MHQSLFHGDTQVLLFSSSSRICSCVGWTDSSEEAVVLSRQKCLCSIFVFLFFFPLKLLASRPHLLSPSVHSGHFFLTKQRVCKKLKIGARIERDVSFMYLSAQCPPWSRGSFRRSCASQTPRPTPTHMCSLLWFFPPPTAGTVHQRWTALPGSSGKHGGRHSLRRGRSDQQRPSAPQLRQGDQREADDLAFFSGEDNSSVQTVDDPSTAGEPIGIACLSLLRRTSPSSTRPLADVWRWCRPAFILATC